MLSFAERLQVLENDLKAKPPAFAMSVDLPFALFRYDPSLEDEGEWKVRREIDLLKTRVENATGRTVKYLSLADLYWTSIAKSDPDGVEALVQLERDRGFAEAEAQVNQYLSDRDPDAPSLESLLRAEAAKFDPETTYLFLTRTGVFAPSAYRISALLEQLMGKVRVPMVMFYPGKWTGSLNFLGLRSDDEPLGSYRVKIYGRD